MEMEAPRFLAEIERTIERPTIESDLASALTKAGSKNVEVLANRVRWGHGATGENIDIEILPPRSKALPEAFRALSPEDPRFRVARIAMLLQFRERIARARVLGKKTKPGNDWFRAIDYLASRVTDLLSETTVRERDKANTYRQHIEALAKNPRRETVARAEALVQRDRKRVPLEASRDIRVVAKKYERLAEYAEAPVDIRSFRHVSDNRREKDYAYQRSVASRFAPAPVENGVDYGGFLENVMEVELGRQDWFGAAFVRSTKYDDYLNGVDGVFEWPSDDPRNAFRLAIDFTVSENDSLLEKKLSKVERGVDVKYFRSPSRATKNPYETSLRGQPMVILGIDRETLRNVIKETGGDPEKMREHPIRSLLLRQAIRQVELQVRSLSAQLVGNVIGREARVSENLRASVERYKERMRENPKFARDASSVVELMDGLSREDMYSGFRDQEQAHRLQQLVGIQRRLRERLDEIKSSGADLLTLRASTLHRKLAGESAFLQPTQIKISPAWGDFDSGLARLVAFCELFRRIALQVFEDCLFGFLGCILKIPYGFQNVFC